jgi:hypothetical protein
MDTNALVTYIASSFSAAFLVGTGCWGIKLVINFFQSMSS